MKTFESRGPGWPLSLLLLLLAAPCLASDDIVAPEARIEKVADGFRFTEGPAADANGDVYFTDIPNQRILRFEVATGKVHVFREDSGRANGLMFDGGGALIACEGGRRRLVRIQGEKTTVLAERYEGKRLNSPNDLAIDKRGGIYFTDPRYGKRDDLEQDAEAVYYRDPEGALRCVIRDLARPNGILLSLDQRTLYVADNAAKRIMAYEVQADGTPAKPRTFANLEADRRGGPDGMTIDERGNVYVAGQGRIYVWNPKGERLKAIDFPEGPANCTFGGKDRKTLYVTARKSLYRLRMAVRGGQ